MDTSTRTPDDDGSQPAADPRAVLERVLDDEQPRPTLRDSALRRSLVAGLDDDREAVRLCSSWAIRLLLNRDPDSLPTVVRSLTADDAPGEAVRGVLAHLDQRYPHRVRPILTDRGVDPDMLSTDEAPTPPLPEPEESEASPVSDPDVVANTLVSDAETSAGAVASHVEDILDAETRTLRGAGESTVTELDDNQSVVATEGDVSTVIERVVDDPEDPRESTAEGALEEGVEETTHTEGDADDGDEKGTTATGARSRFKDQGSPGTHAPRTHTQQKRAEIQDIQRSALFRQIRDQTDFEDLTVVLPRDGRRYADTIRARATTRQGDLGVAVRLLDQPDEADTEAYVEAVADQCSRWQGIHTSEGVVTVHDWGTEPRPWLVTEPVEGAIEDWQPPSAGARFRCALRLVESVAVCHRQGVVHAGIDPGNIVIPGDALDTEPWPQLDNVGLFYALVDRFDRAAYLDARYTAPEYLDPAYGDIDHSTDIYQLGAVVYRLLTGRPPFHDEDGVEQHVLETAPPAPTDRNPALPDAVDEIIGKAMAKQKLLRYETISQFRGELRAVCAEAGYGVHG